MGSKPNRQVILAALVAAFLVKGSQAEFCVPCPQKGMTMSSYMNCPMTCDWGKLYNNATNTCVFLFECPSASLFNPFPDLGNMDIFPGMKLMNPFADFKMNLFPDFKLNPFPQLNALTPLFSNAATNLLTTIKNNKIVLPKDYYMAKAVVSQHMNELQKTIRPLVTSFVTPAIIKDPEILKQCQSDSWCILEEALKLEDNLGTILPKLKPIFEAVVHQFGLMMMDLEKTAQECNYTGNCPWLKGFMDFKKLLPIGEEDVKQFLASITTFF